MEQHPLHQEEPILVLGEEMAALAVTVILLTVLAVVALVDIQETAGLVTQVLE
jgi:hypothetical protein